MIATIFGLGQSGRGVPSREGSADYEPEGMDGGSGGGVHDIG